MKIHDDSERSLTSLARAYCKWMLLKGPCMANANFCYLESIIVVKVVIEICISQTWKPIYMRPRECEPIERVFTLCSNNFLWVFRREFWLRLFHRKSFLNALKCDFESNFLKKSLPLEGVSTPSPRSVASLPRIGHRSPPPPPNHDNKSTPMPVYYGLVLIIDTCARLTVNQKENDMYIRDNRGDRGQHFMNLSVTDNCYKLLKSLHLIGREQICQWKTPTKHFMKCPPGLVFTRASFFLYSCVFSKTGRQQFLVMSYEKYMAKTDFYLPE